MPKFRLLATSVYASRPSKSMILIEEPGSGVRWVRQGDVVGYFLIESIDQQGIHWRQGEHKGEMAMYSPPPGKSPGGKAVVRLASELDSGEDEKIRR